MLTMFFLGLEAGIALTVGWVATVSAWRTAVLEAELDIALSEAEFEAQNAAYWHLEAESLQLKIISQGEGWKDENRRHRITQ